MINNNMSHNYLKVDTPWKHPSWKPLLSTEHLKIITNHIWIDCVIMITDIICGSIDSLTQARSVSFSHALTGSPWRKQIYALSLDGVNMEQKNTKIIIFISNKSRAKKLLGITGVLCFHFTVRKVKIRKKKKDLK